MNSGESEAGEEYYDELESDDKRSKNDDGGYILRNVLKLPRATTYTTQALYGMPLVCYVLRMDSR
jgi:hypothetical protein